jgi:hypothetical protein
VGSLAVMRLLAESFYDSVLRELVFALGAALFVANAYALYRRRADADKVKQRTVARTRPGSPVRGSNRRNDDGDDLVQAPVARTVAYLVIGFVVMVAGLGAMLNK